MGPPDRCHLGDSKLRPHLARATAISAADRQSSVRGEPASPGGRVAEQPNKGPVCRLRVLAAATIVRPPLGCCIKSARKLHEITTTTTTPTTTATWARSRLVPFAGRMSRARISLGADPESAMITQRPDRRLMMSGPIVVLAGESAALLHGRCQEPGRVALAARSRTGVPISGAAPEAELERGSSNAGVSAGPISAPILNFLGHHLPLDLLLLLE